MVKQAASAASVSKALAAFASPTRAFDLQWFFKTEPGGYGEGDKFRGVRVPDTRIVARQFAALPIDELQKLSKSKWHEERLCALVILVTRFEKSKDPAERKTMFDLWLTWLNLGYVNNWDLVDVSAPRLGAILVGSKGCMPLLKKLAKSPSLWERRASVILTFAHLRAGSLAESLEMCELLIGETHDLMHKAVGWVLREVGNRDVAALQAFLTEHAATMPRTALRYAIEKRPEVERRRWLNYKNL
ncbi:MAG: DNA alkylation repair protein [Micrococcales bacterium]